MAQDNPWWQARRGVFGLALLLALLLTAGAARFAGDALTRLDELSTDLAWRMTASRQDERRLIIIDIDERSLQEIGPWPWPREVMARLSRRIVEIGGGQQIFDLVFVESRRGDTALEQTLTATRPVLAQVFALEQGEAPRRGQLAGALDWSACPAPFQEARGYLANIGELRAGAVGHITPRIAADGAVRSQPAVICFENRAYPALAIAGILNGTAGGQLELQQGTGWLAPPWRLASAGIPYGGIPLDALGDMRVPWRLHPDSFVSLAAADVLAGRVPAGLSKNAWVLVGSTAFGLNDSIPTPFGGTAAGLQVHAELITAMLDGRVPYTPRLATGYRAGMAILGLLLLAAWYLRSPALPIYMAPLGALAWTAALYALHVAALTGKSLWLGWVSPALLVLLASMALATLEHARSRFERNRLYAHLSSYLPAPVAASLALQPPSSAIKAQWQNISVMFADIRNFSAYCEARPPEEAAAVLHAFFSTATQIVEAEGGLIDAFQGDAVIAVWSDEAAAAGDAHPARALRAAAALLAAVRPILPDPAPAGLEPLALGIGIETGPAMVGSFGLARRRTHMALGRTVTIASRLVGMTAELAHPILVGEGLAAQITDPPLDSMGVFLLEGLRTPHHIYGYPLAAPDRTH